MRRLEHLRALLTAHGARPRKALGQNFLVDANFCTAIVRAAAPDERTLILEAGPGTGALTSALLQAHPRARVLAMELDPALVRLLRAEFAGELSAGRLTLLEGDVLAGKRLLEPVLVEEAFRVSRAEGRTRRVLCSNLAYNFATPLLANLAAMEQVLVEETVATVQWESAQRFLAAPGGMHYGPLAAFLRLRGGGEVLRRVGPEVFWPRPKVHSAVLRLRLPPWEQTAYRTPREAREFLDFLHLLFGQRRKTLRAILGAAPAGKLAGARAEDLAPEVLLELFRRMRADAALLAQAERR
jgi:16S rRNA (adenine1518-N6/adenine1519-N6)-dimethyltransferase